MLTLLIFLVHLCFSTNSDHFSFAEEISEKKKILHKYWNGSLSLRNLPFKSTQIASAENLINMIVMKWIAAIILVICLDSVVGEQAESVQTIDHPDKNEYTAVKHGTDKHKYGYELKENRVFHHTTSEDDGVRLGCYGYVLFGKKYSTQYVADANGYRPVTTYDPVPVYPRSGGERKASFVGDFSEEEEKSRNIRYFFPDGCRGVKVAFESAENIPPSRSIVPPKIATTTQRPVIFTTKTTTKTTTKPKIVTEPPRLNVIETTTRRPVKIVEPTTIRSTTPKPTTPKPTTIKPTTAKPTTAKPTTAKPTETKTTAKPTTIKITPQPSYKVPIIISPPEPKSCPKQECCNDDDSIAKLILPVPLKNSQGPCQSFAKLVVPIDGLSQESLRSLTNGFSNGINSSDLIKNVLKLLS